MRLTNTADTGSVAVAAFKLPLKLGDSASLLKTVSKAYPAIDNRKWGFQVRTEQVPDVTPVEQWMVIYRKEAE